jgi:hypothetical protein
MESSELRHKVDRTRSHSGSTPVSESYWFGGKLFQGSPMAVFFNNCRCRKHAELFEDSTAFYDLNTFGLQAKMATNLKPGTECIVATYDDDCQVVFSWHTLLREAVKRDPGDGTKVRVFFGKLIKTERFS